VATLDDGAGSVAAAGGGWAFAAASTPDTGATSASSRTARDMRIAVAP
jgi:hypothetical protein